MDQVTLAAETRTESGTRPTKRLRRQGLVPAVVYGRGIDPLHVKLVSRDLMAVLRSESGLNTLINVDVDGGDTVLAVAREIQRHPVRGDITHLDLIKVSLDEAIEADVQLEFVGIPAAVRDDGAIVETIESTVVVEALPTAIPSSIELDITDLEMGDTLAIADLPAIDGVVYVDDEDRPIVTLTLPRAEVEEEVVEGDELEGEEGDAEDGDAEASDDADGGAEG